MRSHRPRGRLTLAAAALLVAGCSGQQATPAPLLGSPSASPRPITGDGYRLSIPAGWLDKTRDATAYKAAVRVDEGAGLLVLVHPTDGGVTAGVNDVEGNIVVLRLTEPVPDDQLEAFASRSGGGSPTTGPARTTVGGGTAFAVTYRQDIQGTPGESEEILFDHGGRTYDVSLTTSQFAFKEQEQHLLALVSSWRWTG